MINPRGKVISIFGIDPNRRALVYVESVAVCPRCAEGKGCGAGLFGGTGSKRELEAAVPTNASIAVGDTVLVTLAPRNVLVAAGIVYGWPLLGASVGAAIAYAFSYGDAAAAASALAGLMLGGILVRRRLGSAECLRQFTPQILA